MSLFICSLIAVAIIIERFAALRRKRITPAAVCSIIEDEKDAANVVSRARSHPSALTRLLSGLHQARSLGPEKTRAVLATLFKKELSSLERGLTTLEVIASIAPLLGLLGTVLGMVDVFNVVAEVGVGQASALSSGIAKALITTIAGLSVAIPTLVFHSYFMKRTETLALQLEEYSQNFLYRLD